jgi:flagellar biosynthetic protein FliR
MNISATLALLDFFENIDILILLIVRCLGFFILVPVIAGATIPGRVKVALALFIAYLIFSTNTVAGIIYEPTIVGYFYIVIIEFLTGFLLAFAVYIAIMCFFMAGQIIDYKIGFAMVNVLNPLTQLQAPITGNILYFVMLLLLVQTGCLHYIIAAFVQSYQSIPIGGAVILNNESLLQSGLTMIINYYVFGLRIALPVMGTIMVLDIALGILVKAVPQMNIFVVGMPIKLLVGLLVFYLTSSGFNYIFTIVFDWAMENMLFIMEALTPS